MIARVPHPVRRLVLSSRLGLVSIAPATSSPADFPEAPSDGQGFARAEARTLLRDLGRSLGLHVLEAGPEEFPAGSLSQDPDSKDGDAAESAAQAAPEVSQGEEAVRLALEGLDVVWMDGDGPVAAFILEPGGGHWEGLRRLADLLALHPKLKAPLYAVTVPSLRAGLELEAHRPVYRLLKKPLAEVLRLLDWARLRTEVEQLGERVRYLKPEFLEGIADRAAPPAAD